MTEKGLVREEGYQRAAELNKRYKVALSLLGLVPSPALRTTCLVAEIHSPSSCHRHRHRRRC